MTTRDTKNKRKPNFPPGPGPADCFHSCMPLVFWVFRVRLSCWRSAARTAGRSEACWVFSKLLWRILMKWQQCKERPQLTKHGQQTGTQPLRCGRAGDLLSPKASAEKERLFGFLFFFFFISELLMFQIPEF